MNVMKHITLIAASPKVGEAAVSDRIADYAERLLACDVLSVHRINVRSSLTKHTEPADFETMLSSDALVFIFPLYFFCLPGLLIRYLQDYSAFHQAKADASKTAAVYCVVNCGFPEPGINEDAVRVIGHFSKNIGAEFRYGLMIGNGGWLLGAPPQAGIMKKVYSVVDRAFLQVKNETITGAWAPAKNFETAIRFPRRLSFFIIDRGWISTAKKNKLAKEDLYARPYI